MHNNGFASYNIVFISSVKQQIQRSIKKWPQLWHMRTHNIIVDY